MTEKQIAHAIQAAHKRHEESWDWQQGEYQLDWDFCFEQACADLELPENIYELLALANHWHNDIQSWAEDILNLEN